MGWWDGGVSDPPGMDPGVRVHAAPSPLRPHKWLFASFASKLRGSSGAGKTALPLDTATTTWPKSPDGPIRLPALLAASRGTALSAAARPGERGTDGTNQLQHSWRGVAAALAVPGTSHATGLTEKRAGRERPPVPAAPPAEEPLRARSRGAGGAGAARSAAEFPSGCV